MDADSGANKDGAAGNGGSAGTAGSAGTSGSAGTGGSGGSIADSGANDSGNDASLGSDTVPPSIVSVSPNDGAKGVLATAKIVVTFSEPMDQARTQAAYQSADLPAANAVLDWDASGKVLTIDPNADLAYAASTDPNAAAKSYKITITTTATDLAGNKLQASKTVTFTTLRRITQAFDGTGGMSPATGEGRVCPFPMAIGDVFDNSQSKMFMQFDIASLPAALTTMEAATATITYAGVAGAPYGASGLGELRLEHVLFSKVTGTPSAAQNAEIFSTAAISVLGTVPELSSSLTPPVAQGLNVLSGVKASYDNRAAWGARAQFRLAFTTPTDNDSTNDLLTYVCNTQVQYPKLAVRYLIP